GVDGRLYYAPTSVAAVEKVANGDVVRLAVDSPRGRPRILLRRVAPPIGEQVTYRGPTWLDAMVGRVPEAPGSFAREVLEGLARRDATLKAMGIQTAAPRGR